MAVKGCDVWAGWAGWAVGRVVLELHGVAASMIAEACLSPGGPRRRTRKTSRRWCDATDLLFAI
jgi:hypothetical protein